MFLSDQLIYIQLQKTACTHIASLLMGLLDGECVGLHNAATADQLDSNRLFVSSIRNPWDWYLSLWTFGVQGNGALMRRLTKWNKKKSPAKQLHAYSDDVDLWRDVYDRCDNVASFRTWLRLVHDPLNSSALGEGYGDTAINGLCGFMTYRYLYLCCTNVDELSPPGLIANYAELVQFAQRNCYIDCFIRQESLEDDLCKVVEQIKPLTQEDRQLVYGATKTNTSKRSLSIADYYDEASIELVRQRDRLLVEKFDYAPPRLVSPGYQPAR